MIIVKLKGGLGNQMFQYACGRSISQKKGQELAFDLSFFTPEMASSLDAPRTYELGSFAIQERIATTEEIAASKPKLPSSFSKIKNKLIKKPTGVSEEAKLQTLLEKDVHYLDGYWQSELYFKDIRDTILKEFTLKTPLTGEAQSIKSQIETSAVSASLHVRRGDYVSNAKTNAFHGTCDLEYYTLAIAMLEEKFPTISFFIFSDDIEWAKEHITTSNTPVFVSRPEIKTVEEMLLMSLCNHHVIANSSFSWWGAWLGTSENSITIAPKKWFAGSKEAPQDLIPTTWIQQ